MYPAAFKRGGEIEERKGDEVVTKKEEVASKEFYCKESNELHRSIDLYVQHNRCSEILTL